MDERDKPSMAKMAEYWPSGTQSQQKIDNHLNRGVEQAAGLEKQPLHLSILRIAPA
jgi:hypothetical protein